MDYKLTELIEQKAFEELFESEKSFVLKHLSEEEYYERYQLISEIKSELKTEAKELKANDHIRTSALEALRSKQQKKKSKVIPMLFNYKIPLWTSVAAIFLVFILTTPFILDTNLNEVATSEQLTIRDTIYIEKIINDTVEITKPADTVVKTVYVSDNNKSNVNSDEEIPIYSNEKNTTNQKKLELLVDYQDYTNPIDLGKRSSGKSLSNDPIGRIVLNISQ